MQTELLSNQDLRTRYGLGRDVARQICHVLPHVQIGFKGQRAQNRILRRHLEILLEYAASHRIDLVALLKEAQPGAFDSLMIAVQGEKL